jgi:hypothetical protein
MEPNLLQPGVLANSTLAVWISRLSDDADLTEDAVKARSPEDLAERLYLRFLTRLPSKDERDRLARWLAQDFERRLTEPLPSAQPLPFHRPRVSWSNHLSEESNRSMLDYGKLSRDGEPPTSRLRQAWRERMEDAVWTLFNLPEFVWMP